MRLFANDIYIGDTVIIGERDAQITAVDGQNIVARFDDGSFDAFNPDSETVNAKMIHIERIELVNKLEAKYPFYNGNAINLVSATDAIHTMLERGVHFDSIKLTYTMIGKRILVERIDAEIEDVRKCSKCGSKMTEGYVVENGIEYICSDKCLFVDGYTPKQKDIDYEDGHIYWTEWE